MDSQATPVSEVALPKKEQFGARVFPAELLEIVRRRERLGREPLPPGTTPSTGLGLVGLAFSGGGIRSASFCLGVVQHLAMVGGLRYVDYLSTVSGGGYVGSCISSLLGDPEPDVDVATAPFPLHKEAGKEEPPALVHLRNGSNYLSPAGPLQQLRVPAVVLRGVVLSLVSLLPYVIVAVLLTRFFYDQVFPRVEWAGADLDFLRTSTPLGACIMLFCALSASYPFVVGFFRAWFQWRRRDVYDRTIAAGLMLVVLALVSWPLASLIHAAVVSTPAEAARALAADGKRIVDTYGIAGLVGGVALAVAYTRSRIAAEILRAIGSAMLGTLGLVLPLVMYLGICLWEITPRVELGGARAENAVTALSAGTVNDELAEAMRNLSGARRAVAPDALEKSSVAVEHVPLEMGSVWLVTSPYGRFEILRSRYRMVIKPLVQPDPGARTIMMLGVLLLILNLRFLDVNITSPHGFFRDQLSKVFLVRIEGGKVLPNDDLRLSDLNRRPNAAAPYHLINATLNLGGSTDPELRGRHADLFFFSKLFVGSERTGYEHTQAMEDADGQLNLGTAMAISAAAASPQMGALAEARGLSALLTLANARLSYWLPNPDPTKRASIRGRLHIGPGPRYLLREALGTTDENQRFVNISDGGHVENLGLYQLLKRRCSLIIAVDGEEDGGLFFGGLVTLMRYAWIDMGVRIDIDLDPIRLRADRTSEHRWAVGTITYGEGQRGVLVYVKASVTGRESEVIRDYRRQRMLFPHESTADQFFTENQLEAYRGLGEAIATEIWPTTIQSVDALKPSPREA